MEFQMEQKYVKMQSKKLGVYFYLQSLNRAHRALGTLTRNAGEVMVSQFGAGCSITVC